MCFHIVQFWLKLPIHISCNMSSCDLPDIRSYIFRLPVYISVHHSCPCHNYILATYLHITGGRGGGTSTYQTIRLSIGKQTKLLLCSMSICRFMCICICVCACVCMLACTPRLSITSGNI